MGRWFRGWPAACNTGSTMSKTASATQRGPVRASFFRAARRARPAARDNSAEVRFVARLRAADEFALSDLVRRYHPALLRVALAFLPNRALAEESVQETWIAVINRLTSFQGRSSLKTWIFRILANRAKARLIREARSVPFSALRRCDPEELAMDSASSSQNGSWADPLQTWDYDNPEKKLMHKYAIGCLKRTIQRLPPDQCAVVTLRDVEGLESDEVCNVLGISEINQRVLLHRARSKLRRALEEHLIAT